MAKAAAEEAARIEALKEAGADVGDAHTAEVNEGAVEKANAEEQAVPVVETPPASVVEDASAKKAAKETSTVEEVAEAFRERHRAERVRVERKVPVNVMLPPSLHRKLKRDVDSKKIASMSALITDLVEAYYSK